MRQSQQIRNYWCRSINHVIDGPIVCTNLETIFVTAIAMRAALKGALGGDISDGWNK